MKFPRNARILRGQLDAAPMAAVLILVLIFVMLSSLVYTPGVHVKLPVANDLPGTDQPTITVALDANNRLYFTNGLITAADLRLRLREAVTNSPGPLTLVVQADEAVTHTNLIWLTLLARDAGIREALLATLPRLIAAPAKP